MKIHEVAPPGMEDWIEGRKEDCKKRYGDKWESVLYATAWNRHNNESLEENRPMAFIASEPTQYRSPESQTQKHRVAVTVSDTDSSAVSQRGETVQKIIRVSGADQADAEKRAAEYYKRGGYRVHDVNYIGILSEQDVAEASWINGKKQDDKELVWKQTGMSYEEAVEKYGEEHVRLGAKNKLGQQTVEVHVPLVAEGMFGIDAKTKGAIQNVVAKLSDIPNMWDHKAQTFTPAGMDSLKSVLKDNPKHIKYAVNLTADDFEADM